MQCVTLPEEVQLMRTLFVLVVTYWQTTMMKITVIHATLRNVNAKTLTKTMKSRIGETWNESRNYNNEFNRN